MSELAWADLSKATKLEDVVFHLGSWSVGEITTALRTVTPEHQALRQISISMPYYLIPIYYFSADVRQTAGAADGQQWLGLDRLLVRLWETRSIHPKVVCVAPRESVRGVRGVVEYLLPMTTTIAPGCCDLLEAAHCEVWRRSCR